MKTASYLWHHAFFCPDNEADDGYLMYFIRRYAEPLLEKGTQVRISVIVQFLYCSRVGRRHLDSRGAIPGSV